MRTQVATARAQRAARWTLAAVPVRILLGAIWLYQRLVSPWLGPRCRFHPTCSVYAGDCLRTHGLWRGLRLSLWRVLRCQPLSAGGLDPVPPRAAVAEDFRPPSGRPDQIR